MVALLLSCNDDEQPSPVSDKVITDIDLIFSPTGGGPPLSFGASDSDGSGEMETDPIVLEADNSYQLFIKMRDDVDMKDLTAVIEERGDEHILYFGFTDELFDQPEGDGNIDTRLDQVNYIDLDSNNLPIGLITGWQTSSGATGTFRILLKQQTGIKSDISEATDGVTDLDLTFSVTVE